MPAIDIDQLSGSIAAKMTEILSGYASNIAIYAESEAKVLATSLAQIAKLRVTGAIDDEEARLHLEIQKNASRAVLMAIAGISIIAAEQAINAALGIVAEVVNGAIGFGLL